MKTPIISIIVPCYNAEKYVRETLDCLQRQTIDNWECVVVNDGSTDGSLEILREYEQIDPRYKVIDSENGGPAAARNKAIAASSGKYILPLDADDLIDPTYTEKAIKYLEEHPECKLVYCEAEFFGDINKVWDLPNYKYETFKWANVIFCSAIYRKKDFLKTDGYNPNMEKMFEDWDFWMSFLGKDDKVYRIPEILFYYRIHSDSRTQNTAERISRARLQIMINHPQRYPFITEKEISFVNLLTEQYKIELESIKSSRSYKIGKILSDIYSKIIRFF